MSQSCSLTQLPDTQADGVFKLVVLGGGYSAPMKSEGPWGGCNPLPWIRRRLELLQEEEASPLLPGEAPASITPKTEPLGEPGLYLKPHASPSDVGKRPMSVHTAHKRRYTPHTSRNTGPVALLTASQKASWHTPCWSTQRVLLQVPVRLLILPLPAGTGLTPVSEQPEAEGHS